MITTSQLINDFKKLGLKSGELVMLHASQRAVGTVLGGPDEVHKALLEAIAPQGTMMMYVGCEGEFENIGKGTVSPADETLLIEHCPAFDPAIARADRDYGVLVEFFRSFPGTICSQNPGARMAARGTRAAWWMENHPLQYGYGPGSPLAKLYEHQGKVVLLGSDLDQVTLLHFAEHITPIEHKRKEHFRVPILENGQRVWHDIEEYDTSVGMRLWPKRFFASIVQEYLLINHITAKKVGNADTYLLDAKSLVDFAVPVFISAAKEYK